MILKNASASKSYVQIGSAYMAFERPRTAGGPLTTDHVSVAIRNIEMARVHALLDERGIAYRDYPSGRDTAIVDADGIRTQLPPENGWSFCRRPLPDAVVLQAEWCSARPASSTSCQRRRSGGGGQVLRECVRAAPRENDRLVPSWLIRIGVRKTPEGQRPGVNHLLRRRRSVTTLRSLALPRVVRKSSRPSDLARRPSAIPTGCSRVSTSADSVVIIRTRGAAPRRNEA